MIPVKDFYFNIETPFPEMRLSASWGSVHILSSFSPVELGIPVRSVFVDTSLEDVARLHINLKEQRVIPTIRQLYDMLRMFKEEDVLMILKRYTKTNEIIDVIKKLKFLDLGKLASLIIWLTSVLELKVASINLVEDLETGQPQFIGVYIEDCGWDEWKILSRTVKKQLISEGLDDVAGRVALVCKQALKTRRS